MKRDLHLHHMKARTKMPRACTSLWRRRRRRQWICQITRRRLKLIMTHWPASAPRTPNQVIHHRRRCQKSVRRYRIAQTGQGTYRPCPARPCRRRCEACAVMTSHRRRKQERVSWQQQVRRGWRRSGRRRQDRQIVGKAWIDEGRRAGRVVDEEYLKLNFNWMKKKWSVCGYCKNVIVICEIKLPKFKVINWM